MEKKESTKNGAGEGWLPFLLEGVFTGLQTFVSGTIDKVQGTAQKLTLKLAQRAFLFFFALLGFILVFVGLAKWVSSFYRYPGGGEMIVGFSILLITLIAYALNRSDN